jgi:hypothetical protein
MPLVDITDDALDALILLGDRQVAVMALMPEVPTLLDLEEAQERVRTRTNALTSPADRGIGLYQSVTRRIIDSLRLEREIRAADLLSSSQTWDGEVVVQLNNGVTKLEVP